MKQTDEERRILNASNTQSWDSMREYCSLYDRMLNIQALYGGFRKVCKAKGATGIDSQNLSDYKLNLRDNLMQLLHELQTKGYQPQLRYPKDGGDMRLLGVPTVRDDLVVQSCWGQVKSPAV